ncbi:hypothetical protein PMIN05_007521 [Paraphaeosphaeria minitans]
MGVKPDGFEASKKIVFALVVALDGVLITETLEPEIRKTLIVVALADIFIFKKIDNGRNILIDENGAVAVQAESITTSRGNVIGLGWSSDTILFFGQKYALIDQCTAIGQDISSKL